MKKKIIMIVSIIVVLTVPLTVFAATSDTTVAKQIRGFFGIDYSKLNDTQKSVVSDYSKKMTDLQKEYINKMVESGALTKAEGDAQIKRIDDMIKNGGETGIFGGFGMGKGGRGGRGMNDGFGMFGIDTSKLTDAQKTELIAVYKNIVTIQKAFVTKAVEDTLLTSDKGTAITKELDETAAALEKGNLPGKSGILMGGLECFRLPGVKNSTNATLSDKQKTDITEYSNSLSVLQKEIITKLVSYGLMTKDQGDKASLVIDEMNKNILTNGFTSDRNEGKGFRNNGHINNKTNTSSDSNSTTTTGASL